MLHSLFNSDPWFAPRRYGLGAGWPIAWQGWALIGVFIPVILGLAALAANRPEQGAASLLVVGGIATTIFLIVARRHTQGGWRWRWGGTA